MLATSVWSLLLPLGFIGALVLGRWLEPVFHRPPMTTGWVNVGAVIVFSVAIWLLVPNRGLALFLIGINVTCDAWIICRRH